MFVISMFKFTLVVVLLVAVCVGAVPRLSSFRELGKFHCKVSDLPLLYRITSGNLAEIYGGQFKEYDAYIRSFIGPDLYYRDIERDQEQEEENPYVDDEIVAEYVKGLNDCGLEWTQKHVYQIWRYVRFMINCDYLFEWLRAKMRISYGYEIQKPNAWMDGQQREERLRLEKLYSNEYLYSLEDLMHRDFLYPILTTLRKNIVMAAGGGYTKSGKPLLVNILETRNYPTDMFFPVEISLDGEDFFSFTIPGLPLLLSGSSKDVAWAFSGILVDRTNVEQIETTGMRFFDEDNERWIKIKKVEESIKVKGEEDHNVTYYWSKDGPLVSKSDSKSKIREFIVKWHENEPKVRVLFSELVTLLKNPVLRPTLYFPFNSLVLVDNKGIHHYVCPPRFPYYFLYPDMLGEPENFQGKQLWASNPKRGFFVVSNTRLTSTKPLGYLDKQVFNSDEEALSNLLKEFKDNKRDLFGIIESVLSTCQTTHAKKIVDNLLTIYRKAKFTYLPDESIRNQNDQLVALLDKWDNKINNPKLGAIYRMWLYFLKMNTFGHSARSMFAKDIARFKLATDTYFAGQTQLWKGVASYGECDIDYYNAHIQIQVNHTGHNSSCYYNILKSINQTRLFFKEQGGDLLNTESSYYSHKKTWNPLREKYYDKVSDADTAFHNTFKEKLILGVELGGEIVYSNDGVGGLKKFEMGEGKEWTEGDYLGVREKWGEVEVKEEPTSPKKEESVQQIDGEL